MDHAGITLDDLDCVVFYEKPLPKFERILESVYYSAPRGLVSFIRSMNTWLTEKLFLPRKIRKELRKVGAFNAKNLKLLFCEHHLSHAASAYYVSDYNDAAVLVIDGVGEWSTASIYYAKDKQINLLKELKFPHSIGLFYSAATYYLGFKVNSGEYKVMGLAPYGDPVRASKLVELLKKEVIELYGDGSIWLNMAYFNYISGLTMTQDKRWKDLLGVSRRNEEDEIEQHHCDLALAIQQITEEVVFHMAVHAAQLTGSTNLCMAGGVALNCVANGKLLESKLFESIFVQPASGDAGGSLGAALYVSHKLDPVIPKHTAFDPFLGPEFTNEDVKKMNGELGLNGKLLSNEELIDEAALLLSKGNVVGWFQGRMEFGPRALGNRSILAITSDPGMQAIVNQKIKKREGFRPFAPVMLEHTSKQYFRLQEPSPYMLFTAKIKEAFIKKHQEYDSTIRERLKADRSRFPAVVHVDHSSRIQTVNSNSNERLYQLLLKIEKMTGDGILLNTSFNVRGEPIVCDPRDAFKCFMNTDLDVLFIENYVYYKVDQKNMEDWRVEYDPD